MSRVKKVDVTPVSDTMVSAPIPSQWSVVGGVSIDVVDLSSEQWNSRADYPDSRIKLYADGLRASGEMVVFPARIVKQDGESTRYQLLDGNTRFLALKTLGVRTVTLKVAEGDVSDAAALNYSALANLASTHLSHYEFCRLVFRAKNDYSLSLEQLRVHLSAREGVRAPDISTLSKMCSVWEKLDPSIREGDFKASHPLATPRFLYDVLCKLPPDKQREKWASLTNREETGSDGAGEEDDGEEKEVQRRRPSPRELQALISDLKQAAKTDDTAKLVRNVLRYAAGEVTRFPYSYESPESEE